MYVVLVAVLALTATAGAADSKFTFKSEELDEQEAKGSQVAVPSCDEEEFLTSDGTQFLCLPLPEPTCPCPGSPDLIGSGGLPVGPLPPTGCPIFEPPTRGAFVCLRIADIIYCSVLCDHRFEFSSNPINPYSCGESTGFEWLDAVGNPRNQLPDCTGFRHRLRLLSPVEFYLPAPCYGLNDNTIRAFMTHITSELREKFGCEECNIENTFIQCPNISGSTVFFNDIDMSRYFNN